MSICKVYSFFLSFSSLLIFLLKDLVYMVEYEILSLNSSVIYFSLLFDWMSLMFLSFVSFIFSMVIIL